MLAVLRSTGLQFLSAVGLLVLSCGVSAGTPAPKGDNTPIESSLEQGKKWETDAVVRQGMENIRQVMLAQQTRISKAELNTQDYRQLAETIEQHLALLMQNRKISKGAEKAFHLVVMVDLTQNLNLMRTGATVPLQRVGALGVLQSLRLYGEFFQHPGWAVGV